MTADEESIEETSDVDVDVAAGASEDDGKPERLKRFGAGARKRPAAKVVVALLTVAAVASLALLGYLLYFNYRPDRATDADAAKAAIAAASEGAVAVLSYSPDTLDRDFSNAKSHLTGEFLSYYDKFTREVVAPAAKQKSVKTTAVVLRAALSELHPDSATALLFVNQSTESKDRPEPSFTSSSVAVTLAKADGKWLISTFGPV